MEQNIYHTPVHHIKRHFELIHFQKYFLNSNQHFQQLTNFIKQCKIDQLSCRFNVWRLCLGVVSIQSTPQQKIKQIQTSRKLYHQKKDEALKVINKKSPIKQPIKKNPLLMMGGLKNAQNKQESDQFLKEQIHKDVERTYQQMKFFQDKSIMKLLNLILFIWCRRNPDVSYKQGMNELLASVVVCYFKQAEFKKVDQRPEQTTQELWQNHLFFNSVQHAESDIFAVFQKIIEIQGDMYKTQADLTIKNKVNPNSKNNTPILQRIMQIKDHKLKHMDLQLFRIIKLQDVQTKTFMLRWIRCMHTRQFDLQNSFVIWDSIFLEFHQSQNSKKNKQFEFIDAMCLAMFMYMRSIVFTKQTAGQILSVYQKYPVLKRGEYLDELITLAWTICEQLRIESQNNQASQSNFFQQSEKMKSLHFMQKKPQKKHEVQTKSHHTKKTDPVQKQLKQTDNKKNHQTSKKNTQPLQHSVPSKRKQSDLRHGQTADKIHQENKKAVKTQEKQKVDKLSKKVQKTIQQPKNITVAHHKSEPFIQKQQTKQVIKQQTSLKGSDEKIDHIKQKDLKSNSQQKKSSTHQQSEIENNINSSTNSIQIGQNVSIVLNSMQIQQILQHLNQSLPRIRDIDAQSHIRKTIKKIQGKVKAVNQLQQQRKLKQSSNASKQASQQNIHQNISNQAVQAIQLPKQSTQSIQLTQPEQTKEPIQN